MKRFGRALVVALGIAVLASVVSLVPQRNVTAQNGPTVTIGSPLPLPVAGTVAAQQSGNWNVGIIGTPTVNASVSLPNPLQVEPVKQSVANFKTLRWNGENYNEVLPDGTVSVGAFTVPPSEQFVITDVSWEAECPVAAPACSVSLGDTVGLALGNSYLSFGKYESRPPGVLIASHTDHLSSGIVGTQLPAPAFVPDLLAGEGLPSLILQGYLVP